jgi:hypothetical protein
MSAAAADYQTANRPAATAARLAGPLIDLQSHRKISRTALNIKVVPEGRALPIDGALQDVLDGAVQPPC